MAVGPLSLSRLLNWVQVMGLCGIEPQGGLPCTVACPKCGTAAKIYSNVHSGGQWFGCFGCGLKGDMITVAGFAYGLDPEATVRKLERDGLFIAPVPDYDLRRYMEMHVNRAATYLGLWEKARQRTVVDDTTELRALRQKLGLDMRLDAQRWLDGPGCFVGGTSRYEVEYAMSPKTVENHGAGHSQFRPFIGKGWDEVLVFPFEDLPGRMKGFMFFGNGHTSLFFLRRWNTLDMALPDGNRRPLDDDAGVAMWYTTAQDHPQFGNKVFVFDDVFVAARLQCDHYLNNLVPLPMLATYTAATGWTATEPSIWQHFRDKQLIFLGDPAQDVGMIRHAQIANGLIGPRPVGNASPLSLLTKIAEEAQPWQEALWQTLGQLPPNQAAGLFLRINFPLAVRLEFYQRCPADVREKLPQIVEEQEDRIFLMDNHKIIEKADGWYNAATGEQFSNTIVRLDEMTYFKQSKKTLYTGRVLFKGKEYPFNTYDAVIESHTGKWLREFLLSAEAGCPVISPFWARRLLALAMKIQEPRTLVASEQLGWNKSTQSMVFPDFTIGPGGDLKMMKAIVNEQNIPGRICIPPKNPIGAEELLEFRKHALCPLGLGIFRCVVQNLLAPAFSQPQLGIALSGDGAERDGVWLAGQLGCVASVNNDLGWPAFTTTPRRRRFSWHRDWQNLMVPVRAIAGDVLACTPGWFVLERAEGAPRLPESGVTLNKLVPDYFKWLLDNKMRMGETVNYHARVDASIATYLGARSQSKPERWLKYFLSTNPDGSNAVDAFFRMLGRLANLGDLPLERIQLFKTESRVTAYVLPELAKVFVAKSHLVMLLKRHQTPLPHWDFIEEACKDVLLPTVIHSMPGWLISEDRWVAAMTQMGGFKPRLWDLNRRQA
jgi:hypothetical protein